MKVEGEFKTKQFIDYLTKFPKLVVLDRKYSKGMWTIQLNDGATYGIHTILWEYVQKEVPHLEFKRVVVQ